MYSLRPNSKGMRQVVSYMKEVALMIEFAAAHGVTLTVQDFRTIDGELTIDGMPADQWLDAMVTDCEERHYGKDGE